MGYSDLLHKGAAISILPLKKSGGKPPPHPFPSSAYLSDELPRERCGFIRPFQRAALLICLRVWDGIARSKHSQNTLFRKGG